MAELAEFREDPANNTRNHLDWDDANDKGNPRNWSLLRKGVSTVIICLIALLTTLGASVYPPGREQVQHEFHTSRIVSILPLSAYNLGLAFGPMISSPCSESFGRKSVYLLTIPIFDIFMLGAGLSKGIASLIICRFLAGVFAAPGVSVAAATITDYTPPEQRAAALSIYYSIPFTGSALGPLVGVFAADAKGWRWTTWVVLIMAAAIHPSALLLRESYKMIILQHRAKKMGTKGPKESGTTMQILEHFITSTIIRPLHMLVTEPLVGFICLYTAFQFALLYTFIVASPWVFQTVYGFSDIQQGLSFLGLLAGCMVAPFILVAVDRFTQKRRATQQTTRLPEELLYTGLYGSLILPIGLFWFAWAARPSTHWIYPIIAQGVAFLGSILVYVPCNLYMLGIYGSKYAASATGASSLTRYTLSAGFPLFVNQMYEALGVGWATSLLAFSATALAFVPWIFYHTGPKLRARSAYEQGT